jgi:hypothetical protein
MLGSTALPGTTHMAQGTTSTVCALPVIKWHVELFGACDSTLTMRGKRLHVHCGM